MKAQEQEAYAVANYSSQHFGQEPCHFSSGAYATQLGYMDSRRDMVPASVPLQGRTETWTELQRDPRGQYITQEQDHPDAVYMPSQYVEEQEQWSHYAPEEQYGQQQEYWVDDGASPHISHGQEPMYENETSPYFPRRNGASQPMVARDARQGMRRDYVSAHPASQSYYETERMQPLYEQYY